MNLKRLIVIPDDVGELREIDFLKPKSYKMYEDKNGRILINLQKGTGSSALWQVFELCE